MSQAQCQYATCDRWSRLPTRRHGIGSVARAGRSWCVAKNAVWVSPGRGCLQAPHHAARLGVGGPWLPGTRGGQHPRSWSWRPLALIRPTPLPGQSSLALRPSRAAYPPSQFALPGRPPHLVLVGALFGPFQGGGEDLGCVPATNGPRARCFLGAWGGGLCGSFWSCPRGRRPGGWRHPARRCPLCHQRRDRHRCPPPLCPSLCIAPLSYAAIPRGGQTHCTHTAPPELPPI